MAGCAGRTTMVDLQGMSASYPADIRPLTSLRFFAAMVVVFHHLGYFMPPTVHAATGVFQKGYLGVDFFFILSGFILTHAYREPLRQGRCTIRDFYVRRFARIYPLHLVTLLIMAGVFLFTPLGFGFVDDWPSRFPVTSFFSHFFMIHAWGREHVLHFNIPSWSISAEWFAYLLFPLLALWLQKFRPAAVLGGAGFLFAAMCVVSYALMPERPITERTTDFSIVRIFPEFMLGMALYLFFRGRKAIGHAAFLLVLTAAAVLILMHFSAPDIFIVLLLAAAIILTADLARTGRESWLSGRVCVWLGEISYAVYMTHFIVLSVILWGVWQAVTPAEFLKMFPFLAAAAVIVTVGVSALSYHALEKPARRWITGKLAP